MAHNLTIFMCQLSRNSVRLNLMKALGSAQTCNGIVVDFSWNVIVHGDAREGKWRGNWRLEWVASTLHTTSEHGVSSITTADAHTSAASSRLNWRPPADLNGLILFVERRNLVFDACAITIQLACTLPFTVRYSISPLRIFTLGMNVEFLNVTRTKRFPFGGQNSRLSRNTPPTTPSGRPAN